MNARLPTPTPDQLVAQWTPLMRSLAYRTGTDLDDIQQEAWLLAATMPHDGTDAEFMADWLSAVRCHAAAQRPGVTLRPSARRRLGEEYIGAGWLSGSNPDDPCQAIQAAQTLACRIGGETATDTERWQRIRQEIELPVESWEIAEALRVSKRHGRRLAAELRRLEGVQADLFEADEEGDE